MFTKPKRVQIPTSYRRSAKDVAAPTPQTSRSLQDNAYEEIKRRIIICAFRPGEYLNEAYVASVIGAGRTPVHHAILRLMLEGMVEIIPRKGVIVRPISLDEVLEILDVRLMLETKCVRLAAERANRGDVTALKAILARASEHIKSRDTEQLMLLDREFHLTLARTARAPVLADILRNLHERSLRFWFISLNQRHHHLAVHEQHTAIVAAIAAGSPDAAEEAMNNHILSTRRNTIQHL
jgi:DNA-binding GntR family transcriptional regulator